MQTKDQLRRGVLRRMAHQPRITIPAERLLEVAQRGSVAEVFNLVAEAESSRMTPKELRELRNA